MRNDSVTPQLLKDNSRFCEKNTKDTRIEGSAALQECTFYEDQRFITTLTTARKGTLP
jgi:hypothetical protein